MVGVTLCMNTLDEANVVHVEEARAHFESLFANKTLKINEIIDQLEKLNYKWGTSDGN